VSECQTAGMSTDWIDNHVTHAAKWWLAVWLGSACGHSAVFGGRQYSAFRPVGIKVATDCMCVLRRLFTLHYCAIVLLPWQLIRQIITLSLFTLRRRRERKSAKHLLFC